MNTISIDISDYNQHKVLSVNKEIISKRFFNPIKDIYVKTTEGGKRISKLFINGIVPVYKIEFSDGYKDTISYTHRLRNSDMEWVMAYDIRKGDMIHSESGDVEVVNIIKDKEFTVDFEIEDIHEYIDSVSVLNDPSSVVDLICEMNDAMNNRYRIPDTRDKIANLWFFIEGNEILNQMINHDRTEGI